MGSDMGGPRRKPAHELTGHRGERTELAVLNGGDLEVPTLPGGISTPEGREQWDAIWSSPVAAYWDRASDMGGLVRYIKLFDEWIATQDIIRATPTTSGSRGQIRPHPLGAAIERLEHSLRSLETRYGLTPKDRVGLGIDIATGIDAGERLRRELEAGAAALEAEMSANIDPAYLIES